MNIKNIKRNIATASRLWARNEYLDRIIAGNKMMWVRFNIKDMVASKEITPEEAEKLLA